MQVVLLAAGRGSRLGALTSEKPKALVSVGGEPLVAHALHFAARLQPSRVVVVGGSGFRQLEAELDRRAASVRLVENPRFAEGNLLSLLAARPHLEGDFLLLNVDHLYPAAIAELVRPEAAEVTAFIDTDRPLGADDMKVERDETGRRLKRIAKTLSSYDAGYVGMTRVPAAALPRYFAAAEAALAECGPAIHVEQVLARLARTSTPPACRDVSGHGWLEVDTPEERERAEAALQGASWR
jgi:choline kinase